MKFQVDTSNSFLVMLQTKFGYEKYQRAKTPKLSKREVCFLYNALFHIKIDLPMKFGVDTSYSLVMFWTKYQYEK